MKGFSRRPSTEITLKRGDESLTLQLHALPPGWAATVRSAFRPPVENDSGKITYRDNDPEYNDLYGYLVVGKALEPSGALETRLAAPWDAAARALRAEFADAGLTSGDLVKMMSTIGELSDASVVEEIRGNSAAPSVATPPRA